MIPTSNAWRMLLRANHTCEVKLNVAGTDYGMDALTSLRVSRSAFGSGSPVPGLAPAGELSVSLYADAAQIPRMALLRPYVRLRSGSAFTEWVPRGSFYVDTREAESSGLLTLRAFDAMLLAEQNYPSSSLTWPALDADVVAEIAATLGISVDSRTTALMTAGFRIPLPAQYSMRETLKYIAALYGSSFVISEQNALRLVCLWNLQNSAELTIDTAHRMKHSPAFPACTGVRFLLDDQTEVFAGDETGYVYEMTCPFATQAAASALLSRMQGFIYRPFSAETAILDPSYELGDTVDAGDGLSGLWSFDLTLDRLCASDVSAPEDEELDHEVPYVTNTERVFTRRIQSVQSELSVQAQEISAKVSRTGGDASSFGWYLDADRFSLMSDGLEVMRVDDEGLSVRGTVNADAGEIGGCSIVNGELQIANANISSLNADKITAGTLSVARIAANSLTSGKLADGAAVNRVIGSQAVSYGKTSFQTTLDQVGTNKANIDTLFGYFTGSASFSSLSAASFWLNGYGVRAGSSIPIGGTSYRLVTWTN